MIVARSLRTMIRWIPVCGPGPRLYCVSGVPSGWRIVKETTVGLPGSNRVRRLEALELVGARGADRHRRAGRGAAAGRDDHGRNHESEGETLSRKSSVQEEEGDDRRRDPAAERDERRQQPEPDVAGGGRLAHPVAWSTTRAVNGVPLFGVTLNASPSGRP